MKLPNEQRWERFKKYYFAYPEIHLALDISRMDFAEDFFEKMRPKMNKALSDMAALEKGAITNPDEHRMVGHYWLRNPQLAPTAKICQEIESTLKAIKQFVADVHNGKIRGKSGNFRNLLLIGIGGSALGPQFVSHALGGSETDQLAFYSLDNTDPDGMNRVFSKIGTQLGQTICLVISKSGGTKETRNGMLEAKAAYEGAGLDFAKHAVAVTGRGSELDQLAERDRWIARFPMWDWVGGRTSVFSAVGLLPAGLQGVDIEQFLDGARQCDVLTRAEPSNPAALLAQMWFNSGNGKGSKNMVILPYKDALEMFSKYLQQLVMESLGKEKDMAGQTVNQGIAVFGNKGSTDQHSYIQQLRDGLNNFFATFIEILDERSNKIHFVEPNVTSGDYLESFLLGTRQALTANGRESLTITIDKVSPFTVGVLIALFERAVGFYASLINVNAYHQPGVEAGKKAAASVIDTQIAILRFLSGNNSQTNTAEEIASKIGSQHDPETIFKVCEHLAANLRINRCGEPLPGSSRYSVA